MDPLSVTASVIAILQLTNKTLGYLISIKDAPKDCQSCTAELVNLLSLLISLKDRAEQRAQEDELWFQQLKKLNVRDGPIDQYKQALEFILSKVGHGEGTSTIRTQFLWKFRKDEIANAQNRIQRFVSLISTALQMDHMYSTHHLPDAWVPNLI